jgi:hypothetical protein
MRRNICWAKVRNHIPKRVPEYLMLRNQSIIAITFSSIDFKKRLSRRDTDERFHLSTAQDKVKNSTKASWGKYGLQGMATLIHSISLSMGLHLCCLKFLALLQVWLCSRMSKSLILGDVLALIKHRFCASICWVNVWNNHVYTLSTNLVPRFSCLFDFRNIGAKLEHFKKSQGNLEFHQNKCHYGDVRDMMR